MQLRAEDVWSAVSSLCISDGMSVSQSVKLFPSQTGCTAWLILIFRVKHCQARATGCTQHGHARITEELEAATRLSCRNNSVKIEMRSKPAKLSLVNCHWGHSNMLQNSYSQPKFLSKTTHMTQHCILPLHSSCQKQYILTRHFLPPSAKTHTRPDLAAS